MSPKKKALLLSAALLLILVIAGCAGSTAQKEGNKQGSLKIAGSTSVFPLVTEIAEEFMKENPEYRVEVQAGGSNVGIESVKNNVVDIGMSSRDLTKEELDEGLKPTVIAYDCIAVVVNPKNPVENLTLEQLRDIFSGKIKNWKEVGGPNKEIIVVNRDEASGTREAFHKLVMGDTDFRDDAIVQPGSGQVKSFVASTVEAIGYVTLGVVDDTVKVLNIDGVEPSIDSVKNNTYRIQRKLYLVTKGEPKGSAATFIDYCLSDKIQENVVKKHFIPVKYVEQ